MQSIRWLSETCDLGADPVSGARVRRLTSWPAVNNNIYCEQPYSTPDGRRIAVYRRYRESNPPAAGQLLVADLASMRLALLDQDFYGCATAAWSGKLYSYRNGCMIRYDMEKLQREELLHVDLPQDFKLGSVDPRERWVYGEAKSAQEHTEFIRVDLSTGEARVFFRAKEVTHNSHLQIEPVQGEWLMYQRNPGIVFDRDGALIHSADPAVGAKLNVMRADGREERELPCSEPYTLPITGHECFIADTGRIAFTTGWDEETGALDPRWPAGNLFVCAPGDKAPTVFKAPEHRFIHLSVSRCGNFFVCDSVPRKIPGPVAIIMGCFASGKCTTIIADTKSFGGAQYAHAHAYLTADNRHVIFCSMPDGIPHVYAAEVPRRQLTGLMPS